MSRKVYADGTLVEEWDDDARTYRRHTDGTERPYTRDETAAIPGPAPLPLPEVPKAVEALRDVADIARAALEESLADRADLRRRIEALEARVLALETPDLPGV